MSNEILNAPLTYTLEQLSDIESIKQLMARYWWYMDNKDWKAWRSVFTDDLKFLAGDHEVVTDSADAMVEMISGGLEEVVTAHQGHQTMIEFTGPNTAKGTWMLNDNLKMADGHIAKGFGYYVDDYEKGQDGRWRIKVIRLTYFISPE